VQSLKELNALLYKFLLFILGKAKKLKQNWQQMKQKKIEQKMILTYFSGKACPDNIPSKESMLFDLHFIYQKRDLNKLEI